MDQVRIYGIELLDSFVNLLRDAIVYGSGATTTDDFPWFGRVQLLIKPFISRHRLHFAIERKILPIKDPKIRCLGVSHFFLGKFFGPKAFRF